MKCLLLGANGQLGQDLLRQEGLSSGGIELIPMTRADLDVTDIESIADRLKDVPFDALINCTSYHKTDEVEHNGTLAVTINAHAVAGLAEACRDKDARFVHISTDYVFGGGAARSPLRESDSPAPVNVYGASKLLGEQLAFARHDDVVVMRVASLFGVAGASGKGGNFVETMVRAGRERGALNVVSDQKMSPTATADIAGWIFAVLQKKAPAGLYHAVNSGSATWFEFAKTIIERAGIDAKVSPIPSSDYPTPAMRPPYSTLDNTKLTGVVGEIRHWSEALDDYLVAKGHIGADAREQEPA